MRAKLLNAARTFFIEHRLLKLAALLLACATVYPIRQITNQLEEFTIPIDVHVERGVAILSQDVRSLQITCRGSGDDLRGFDEGQAQAVVRPEFGGHGGSEVVPIGLRDLTGVPRRIDVVKIRPDVVRVSFDRETERQIAVGKPELVGQPLAGKAELDFEPKVVTLRGPQSKLLEKKIVRAEPVDVTGVVDSFRRKVKLLESDIEGFQATPAEITAHISIVTESISREWAEIPVMVLLPAGTPHLVEIKPATVTISLHGGVEQLKSLTESSIKAFIEVDSLATGTVSRATVQVHVPSGLNVSAAATPPAVNARLKQAEQ